VCVDWTSEIGVFTENEVGTADLTSIEERAAFYLLNLLAMLKISTWLEPSLYIYYWAKRFINLELMLFLL